MGLDTKTYWLTDCQAHYDSDSDSDQEVSPSWEAVNQGHEAVMERCSTSTKTSWEFSSVLEAAKKKCICKSAAVKTICVISGECNSVRLL
jgi:hypothetical protein